MIPGIGSVDVKVEQENILLSANLSDNNIITDCQAELHIRFSLIWMHDLQENDKWEKKNTKETIAMKIEQPSKETCLF